MAASPQSFSASHFDATLARHRLSPIRRESVRTLQVNVGKLCNQACHHCHVDAGPRRTEIMTRATAERVIEILASSPGVTILDITGGAPELNPNFAMLVERARALARTVIIRCNLTVTLEPPDGMARRFLPAFTRRADLLATPATTAENVDQQRGNGVFEKSIVALRQLNAAGFRRGELRLDLVYNPLGASLPAAASGTRSALPIRTGEQLRHHLRSPVDHHQHADRAIRASASYHRRSREVYEPARESLQSGDGGRADVSHHDQHRMGRASLRLRLQSDARNSPRWRESNHLEYR